MNPYAEIPDQPDRDTDDHTRTLYAETHMANGAIRIMSTGPGEWIQSDEYAANFR